MPGALDRLGELALLLRGNRGDPAGHDLAAFGHEALEQADVLVVDLRRILAGERAALAAAEKRTGHRDYSPSRSRRRLPRSRSCLRIITDGPLSSSSTRTVMKRMTSSLIAVWRSSSATTPAGASRCSMTKCALRFFWILSASERSPQVSVLPA